MLPHDCGRVLELGCGSGATLAWLQQTGRAAYTAGVEISEAAAQVARQHVGEVHCADMERTEVSFAGGQFNLVLCLDVLEHLVDPWAMVDRLVRQQLVPGGTIIVSVPNIRHFKVLLPLVFQGRWDYTDAGHLDRTHLRFFTRRSAIALLNHRNLSSPVCRDTGFTGWSRKNLLNALTLGLFRDFVTYQFYLVAQKLD